MKTSSYTSWWREMGAISRGMMFIEGSIATPAALEGVQPAAESGVSAAPRDAARDPVSANLRRKVRHLYRDLLLLGGRPMTAGHNDDIGEPFPQADVEPARSPPRRQGGGPARPQRAAPARPCATC